MAYLGTNIPTIYGSGEDFKSQLYSGDGTTIVFTLPDTATHDAQVVVTIDGVKQHTDTYSVSGTTLTFSEAPPTGTDNIEAIIFGADVDIGTPSDNTVTTSKIADETITSAKIIDGAVTSAKITDEAITSAKITDGAVTSAKIATGAAVPSQTGHSGKYLGTDGSTATWSTVVAGATGGGDDAVFVENETTVTTDYTLSTDKNASSVGPVAINTGVTVTVPTGARWVIL